VKEGVRQARAKERADKKKEQAVLKGEGRAPSTRHMTDNSSAVTGAAIQAARNARRGYKNAKGFFKRVSKNAEAEKKIRRTSLGGLEEDGDIHTAEPLEDATQEQEAEVENPPTETAKTQPTDDKTSPRHRKRRTRADAKKADAKRNQQKPKEPAADSKKAVKAKGTNRRKQEAEASSEASDSQPQPVGVMQWLPKVDKEDGYDVWVRLGTKPAKKSKCVPCDGTTKSLDPNFEKMVCRSELLEYTIPSSDNRLTSACPSETQQKQLVKSAQGTRPIIHHRAVKLVTAFLEHKKANGTSIEKNVYTNLSVTQLVQRMMVKRPLVFMTKDDAYMLRDGHTFGQGGFTRLGTRSERSPLVLADYQSYEEMEIAALLGMSVPTPFINDGSRNNKCIRKDTQKRETEGISVGLVGSRFERASRMEWKHMVVTQEQNTPENGYGKKTGEMQPMLQHWAELYGVSTLPTYDEAVKERRTKEGRTRFATGGSILGRKAFLDTQVYKARCRLTAELFLAEANERAAAVGATAFTHVVGLGLGVWKVHPRQGRLQQEAYMEAAQNMDLPHVGTIFFSYMGSCLLRDVCKSGKVQSRDGSEVKFEFGQRRPADQLPKVNGFWSRNARPWLLVTQYAWDANSYPGNEYWMGSDYYAMSGDPAQACSTFIPELQNPDVNEEAFMPERVHVVPAA